MILLFYLFQCNNLEFLYSFLPLTIIDNSENEQGKETQEYIDERNNNIDFFRMFTNDIYNKTIKAQKSFPIMILLFYLFQCNNLEFLYSFLPLTIIDNSENEQGKKTQEYIDERNNNIDFFTMFTNDIYNKIIKAQKSFSMNNKNKLYINNQDKLYINNQDKLYINNHDKLCINNHYKLCINEK